MTTVTTVTGGEPALADTDFRCKHCDRPMWRKGTPPEERPAGSVLHSGRGACSACYHRLYTLGGNAEAVTAVTAVTNAEPVTVTDPATPPLWHARRVTAGAASGVTEALAALQAFGLMPDQLAAESAHLLELVDFDAARAINEPKDEEAHMATDLDTAPQLDMSPAAVRAWARTRDLDVSPKGMVPRSITEAYVAAGGAPGTAIVSPAPSPKPAPKVPPVPMPAVTVPDPVPDDIAEHASPVGPEPVPEAGSVGRATVAGIGDGVLVFRIAHSARGEYGWVAATEWPNDRFGVVFEDDEVTDFVPENLGAKIKLTQEQARTIERLQREVSSASAAITEAQHDAETVRAVLLTTEEQRNQNRVEANMLAVELAEARQASAVVVSTLPGSLPEEILELLAAWHALFAKAGEVDTAAGHTLAEVALPALVRETSDQTHDLIRLLDGDVTR